MWWRRRTKLAELDAEMRAHHEMLVQERMSSGEPRENAERYARNALGDLTRARESTSDVLGGAWVEQAVADFRHAARGLMRSRSFTITATLTLVIGIGASAAAFAILRGVLLTPLPFDRSGQLVDVWQDVQWPASRRLPQNPALYFTYRSLARSIESIGLYQGVGSANITNEGGPAEPERVAASWMTATIFSTLRAAPIAGRVFTESEDRQGGPNVVVISTALWRERFGGRPDVVGARLIVNDIPREVIGVMPENFHFPTQATRLWLPARLEATNPNTRGSADDFSFYAVARLREGVTPEAAQRDLAAVLPRVADMYPEFAAGITTREWLRRARPAPFVVPLRADMTGDIAKTLWMLAGAAVILLLVASANVINLLLIRADERRVQLAVRHALGASRLRVMSHFFAEAMTLASVAGVLGLGAASVAIHSFAVWGADTVPRATELHLDAATIGFTLIVVLGVAIVCAVVPALRTAGTPLFAVVREGSLNSTSGRAQHRFRSAIAAVQLALALIALNGSILMLRTFHRLHAERPGFDMTNVTTYWMQLPVARNSNDSSITAFYARLLDRVAEVPGVRAVGVTSHVPLGRGDVRMRDFQAEAGSTSFGSHASLQVYSADAGYFAALQIPLVAGQLFSGLRTQSDLQVVVSRSAARELWGDSSGATALGKRVRMGAAGPAYTIIGVVGDVRDAALSQRPLPTVYFPEVPTSDIAYGRHSQRTMGLVIRTSGTMSPTPAVKAIVHDMNPTLPIFDIMSMSRVMEESMAALSVTMLLLSGAAVIALVLGMIGLYGIMDYVVALRSREIGLRVVLGAQPLRIAGMMTAEGLTIAVAGVIVGIGGFLVISDFLRAFLYGVGAADPATFAGSAGTLLVVAALANWLPARRAARIDPRIVLRSN